MSLDSMFIQGQARAIGEAAEAWKKDHEEARAAVQVDYLVAAATSLLRTRRSG